MKLLTAAIKKQLPPLYATEALAGADKTAVVKFFDPTGRGTWYGVEFDGKDQFFGWVVSPLGADCDEWGYFSLAELQAVRCRFGLGVERDMHFEPTKMSAVFERHS